MPQKLLASPTRLAHAGSSPELVTSIHHADRWADYSPEPHAVPLIIVHGWPGSVLEFLLSRCAIDRFPAHRKCA